MKRVYDFVSPTCSKKVCQLVASALIIRVVRLTSVIIVGDTVGKSVGISVTIVGDFIKQIGKGIQLC